MEPPGGRRRTLRKEAGRGKGRFGVVENISSKDQCLLRLSSTEVFHWETVLPETCSHTTSMGDSHNGAYNKLYRVQDNVLLGEPRGANEDAGRKGCPAGHVGGESAELGEPEWAEDDIVLVDRVDNGEGECICAWGTSKRSPSCVQGRAATSSPRRRPINIPGRGEVVEPAAVQAAILVPSSPPRRPELPGSQNPLARATESDEGSDASSAGADHRVEVEGQDHVFDMEFDETNAIQPGTAAGAFVSRLVPHLAHIHPNNSDVSSLDIGPNLSSVDENSREHGRQPPLDLRRRAANVLSSSCPVTVTRTIQRDPSQEDRETDATSTEDDNVSAGNYYRDLASSSEEDEQDILLMKGPSKNG